MDSGLLLGYPTGMKQDTYKRLFEGLRGLWFHTKMISTSVSEIISEPAVLEFKGHNLPRGYELVQRAGDFEFPYGFRVDGKVRGWMRNARLVCLEAWNHHREPYEFFDYSAQVSPPADLEVRRLLRISMCGSEPDEVRLKAAYDLQVLRGELLPVKVAKPST